MADGAQFALAPGAQSPAPARRSAGPVPASAARPVVARGREPAPRRLLFAGCVPDPRWASVLARRGIQVEITSAEEAIRRLVDPANACLVLDADAAQSHAALRDELARAAAAGPVALLASAPALFAAMADWKAFGVAHVLLKPVELDELLAIVEPASAPPAPRLPSLERLQREYIRAVLVSCDGNVSEAARQLGMYRQSLQRMLRRHPAGR